MFNIFSLPIGVPGMISFIFLVSCTGRLSLGGGGERGGGVGWLRGEILVADGGGVGREVTGGIWVVIHMGRYK